MPPLLLPLIVTLSAFADATPLPMPVRVSPPPAYAVPLGDLALRAAKVAIKTSGLPANDSEVDGILTRARLAGLMPEISIRGTQTETGIMSYSSDTGTVSTSDYGPGFSIQASLTFHFDKLVYSGQEARVERLRMERMDARARITQRVIDEVGKWTKAMAEERYEPEGSPAHVDATVRRTNAQMALDVWTAGWFSAFLDGRSR